MGTTALHGWQRRGKRPRKVDSSARLSRQQSTWHQLGQTVAVFKAEIQPHTDVAVGI